MKSFPFPDRRGAYDELKRDAAYDRIPAYDREAICNQAWQTGVDAAAVFVENGKQDIGSMIQAAGLKLIRKCQDKVACQVRYFSEYSPCEREIVLYTLSVEKFAKSNDLGYEEAEELILAHEFFHHLECTAIGRVSALYTVPNFAVKKRAFGKTSVRALSEIAAHGFARTYWEYRRKNL